MITSNKLYCLDGKIEKLYNSCQVFLTSDSIQISKLSHLSIFPTFLFNGYPGTGKSSVASILYEKLKEKHNIDIARLNIDELISHNFGESSSNLRAYFHSKKEEIKNNKSHYFIIIDELDSFTINRYQNDNDSIKRILLTFNTIIDDLIRNDEIYKFIIIATTNIKEVIDTSILRRFYFKEDFNIQLNEDDFVKLLNELGDLTEIRPKGSLTEIFQIYNKKKYTLGEVKSIYSKVYFNTLICKEKSFIDAKDFSDYQTFYELESSYK
ncbi:ATP-binding protein [Klebsiella pneumoniae]|nr:AAA family ATPase [Klebsiella pneumoniae]HCE0282478.1 AAA family ATPase [Klebsiella pneumoniae]